MCHFNQFLWIADLFYFIKLEINFKADNPLDGVSDSYFPWQGLLVSFVASSDWLMGDLIYYKTFFFSQKYGDASFIL